MQIKKFTADTHWAAMQQVKQEWGNSALILNTRSVPAAKTWGSKRRNPRVEITAAFDEPRESAKPSPGIEDADSPLRETMLLKQDAVDPDFKAMVCTLLSQTDKARSLGLEGHQLVLYRKLVDSGIHEKLAAKIFEKTQAGGIAGGSEPPSVQQQRLSKLMKRAVVCKGAIQPIADRPKITALVGPTGVGKTTTLAKLAANYAIQQRNNVAMITLDTYRVGAVDQLKVYGDLMQVPVETASGREDF
ncbi:MAG: flagellar biosynthesis protein FlhF, partial [Nitrospinota bacterium]|nr:flagellar biosynthesis protein FlhF [Nitrospinota bacterium]